jgi:hypothetical protein
MGGKGNYPLTYVTIKYVGDEDPIDPDVDDVQARDDGGEEDTG